MVTYQLATLLSIEQINTPKIVVFAYHLEVIDLLLDKLSEYSPVEISGRITTDNREKNITAFQDSSDSVHRVLVGQITAAGVGITLTTANTIVFVESFGYQLRLNRQ